MAESDIRTLDSTDTLQIIKAIQKWINGLGILESHLWLEYIGTKNGLGFCIKADGGAVDSEDILGNFTATVPFIIYCAANVPPDGAGDAIEPLNSLSAWFKANGTLGLDIGARRTACTITTQKGPTDLSGRDEDGSTTFFSVFTLTYDEETA